MVRSVLVVSVGALALASVGASTPKANGRLFFYSVKSEVVEVTPGHWTGPYENRGVCVMNVGQKDEEAGVFTDSGTFDGVWISMTTTSSCGAKATNTCTFRDGSSYTTEAVLTCTSGPDGKPLFKGDAKIVRGTGRFEGIRGKQIVLKGQTIAPQPGELHYDLVSLLYTLPRK